MLCTFFVYTKTTTYTQMQLINYDTIIQEIHDTQDMNKIWAYGLSVKIKFFFWTPDMALQ